ncbi:hypothetical protein [Metallosphaera hakonensis]|uniref:Uncharacterized protein n=1 Tax=Metallosphaera hakonensis JCM 8857 = DSM 7519 TaxID=1293036 RepID=A0A2U9ITB0_9CREN|nr:hypothetical protein [Metallosphaera hakonensis]AWR99157.1 hypothetical protein DFR87_04965 [Metallosphaera hakonensis JCM 8857 = DSM 7519]
MAYASLFLLIILASLMVTAIVGLIYAVFKVTTKIGLFFVYFGFLMMLFMLVGASIYLFKPTETSLGIAVGINMVSMILLIGYFFAVAEQLSEKINLRWYHYYSLSVFVVVNELMMGLTFGLAQFGVAQFSTVISGLYYSFNSYWFFYPMMAEMLFIYLIALSKGINNTELFPLIGVATFPPVIFQDLLIWRYISLFMTLGFSAVGLMFKGRWRYLYILIIVGVVSTLITPWLFDLAIALSMVEYYVTSFRTEKLSKIQ